jgi:hypothetical protein
VASAKPVAAIRENIGFISAISGIAFITSNKTLQPALIDHSNDRCRFCRASPDVASVDSASPKFG